MAVTTLMTDTGEAILAYLLKGDTTTKGYVTHIAIGTGTGSLNETDNALGNEISRKSATATVSTGSDIYANKVTFEALWDTNEGNGSIAEAGLFTASTGGNMFARARIDPAVNKTSDYTLKITWEVAFE
ncbi:MAG: phage tail protein [Candidatus Bathyarchaeia archaeon]